MNEVQTINATSVSTKTAEDYKAIAIEWLTATGNLQKFTENEKKQFCDICQAYGLNPIKKEVYGIKYGNQFNLIVGYESYIKRAERSGQLNGWKCEIVGSGNNMKAILTIWRKDWAQPFTHEVYFEEYNTNQNLWKSKPRTMLKKVAIAQGFRMCFSEELGGMPYTADELPEEMTTPIETPSVNTSATKEKNVTPKQPKKEKKFTKEQADKLSLIMNAKTPDGADAFSKEEKDSYRQMLIDGLFEDAYKSASELLEQKQNGFSDDPDAQETEVDNSELDEAANLIF